jgi:integrase
MRRGSLRQRGTNTWQLRVYLGINPDTGGQRYATRTVRGSRREATRQLALLVAEVDNARIHAGTVTDLLERWFAAAARGWAPTTVAHTRSIIDCHLIPQLGHLPVAKVTTADIDDFYGWLLTFGGADRRGLSSGTVRRVHSVLHRALVQALRWEWIWINPAAQANPSRVRRTEIRPPSPAELAAMLAPVGESNPELCVFLRMAATTGARRGELLALRWADVDLA